MILKIKRYSDNQDWWILDDIRKMSVSRRLEATRKRIHDILNENDVDICLLDNLSSAPEAASDHFFPFMELICRRTDGTEFMVMFDTVAYLCNDEGKTVEKITV